MLNSNDCFREIGESVSICDYFEKNVSSLSFVDYYGYKVSFIPKEVFLFEPILKKINDVATITHAGIMKLEPNRFYDWHTDTMRGVAINLLLTPNHESFVLFGQDADDSEDQYKILRFDYKPKTFYLFNTQINHCVVNFNSVRYAFTLEFEKDKTQFNFFDAIRLL